MLSRKFSITAVASVAALLASSTGLIAAFVWTPHVDENVEVTPVFTATDMTGNETVKAEFDAEMKFASSELEEASTSPVAFLEDDTNIGESLRSYRLRTSQDGFVPGRISIIDPQSGELAPLKDLKIRFVQQGKVVKVVQPSVNGVFQASGLTPGHYGIIASGESGFFAVAAEILPPLDVNSALNADEETQNVVFQIEQSQLQLNGAAIPPSNFTPLRELVDIYLPNLGTQSQPGMSSPGIVPSSGDILDDSNSSPVLFEDPATPPIPATPTTKELKPAVIDLPPAPSKGLDKAKELGTSEKPAATTISHHSVRLTPDGELKGRVRRFHPRTGRPIRIRRLNIFLLDEGKIVRQAPIRENGTFTIPNVHAGSPSLVAAGLDGFMAFGIHVLPAFDSQSASTAVSSELILEVAHFADFQGGGGASGAALNPQDAQVAADQVRELTGGDGGGDGAGFGDAPPGGGGFGGGGAGGGAGGGGLGGGGAGGLGPALLGAGLGAGIAAALDDDDVQSNFTLIINNP